ncbi:hypothetical protein IL54_0972 [Sphingobium sp. ba1]|jgi:hypothetical protein|uniref:hypothetical protein n=1 Tax=Sphingobium sp. ba1 TaxID=1522072 RepID=UPI000503D152|nr:hypothetical protein [Sphingobium sp. ba1]KFL45563.1 hypothetical protein IL54_0972 [Sphingobium sp. ba1]
MRAVYIIPALALSFPAVALAQDNECTAQEAAINEITALFAKDQENITSRSESIKNDAGKAEISGTVDIKMVEQKLIFDIPTVVMKTKAMSLDLPQVTMNLRAMSWDEPVITMVAKKVGQYPEFRCSGGWIPKCKVEWSDIIAHVPVTTMQRREIKMHIPETKMDRTDFKLDIPEIHSDRKEWFVKIPEVTLRNFVVEAEKLKSRGDELGSDAMALAARQKETAAQRTAALFECHLATLQEKRAQVAGTFETALNTLDSSIETMRKNGADPSKVVTNDSATPMNLLASRSDLIAKRDAALAQIDSAVTAMQKDEKLTVEKTIA